MFPLSQRLLARLTFGQVFCWIRPEDIISMCGKMEVVNRSTHVGLVPEGPMRGQRPKEWPSGRSAFLVLGTRKTRILPQKLSSCWAPGKREFSLKSFPRAGHQENENSPKGWHDDRRTHTDSNIHLHNHYPWHAVFYIPRRKYYKTVERGNSSNGVLVVTRIIWGCYPWIID